MFNIELINNQKGLLNLELNGDVEILVSCPWLKSWLLSESFS